ncbi:DUF4064 domain-containing protein [Lysinibacillus yapensis]|uniref:DUF4064 domain-containing protein n=1 Tax=Ureibacillus yapensis TaxID=2304605 RepID=A0A396SAP3_9BACL|nr:DUF4064 domain-containing protein [Lysinibacillus yapensis]RHW38418.1 DUF4064 domain-containing protein [Lysinibacillus yapensis]
MKRTGEKVLSIIATILNVLSIGFLILLIIGGNMMAEDPLVQAELENQFSASGVPQAEMQEMLIFYDDFLVFLNGIGWLFVVLGIIAIVLTIVGIVKVNKNAKLAGILFIISALLSGIISLPGILLIIAAIMCFVRKPKYQEMPVQKTDENGYIID